MLESDGGVQPSIRTQGGIIMLPKESAQDPWMGCAWIWTLADDGGGIELKVTLFFIGALLWPLIVDIFASSDCVLNASREEFWHTGCWSCGSEFVLVESIKIDLGLTVLPAVFPQTQPVVGWLTYGYGGLVLGLVRIGVQGGQCGCGCGDVVRFRSSSNNVINRSSFSSISSTCLSVFTILEARLCLDS